MFTLDIAETVTGTWIVPNEFPKIQDRGIEASVRLLYNGNVVVVERRRSAPVRNLQPIT